MLRQGKQLFQRVFPERQIFFRTRGEVRFLRLSPAIQALMATCALGVFGWMAGTSYFFLTGDSRLSSRQQELAYAAQEMDALLAELARLQDQALSRAERLESRQKLLERINGQTAEGVSVPVYLSPDGPQEDDDDRNDHDDDTALLDGSPDKTLFSLASFIRTEQAVAETPPPATRVMERTDFVLKRLDMIEHVQEKTALLLIDREREKISSHRSVIESLGLKPDQFPDLPKEPLTAMGGPFLNADAGFMSDTFRILSELDRDLNSYRQVLSSVPSRVPAKNYYISSLFGSRKDPFHKSWATHSGVDLAGWPGEPILAAGQGRIVKAGRAPAYGLMIEIDHGNGFRTRYGHMRRLLVKAGETVEHGQKIGEMGSTGRSTSTHLHWEVWLNGKLVDPLPFIKAAKNVYTLQQDRHEET